MSIDEKIKNIEPILKAVASNKSVDLSEIEDIEAFVKSLASAAQSVVNTAMELLPEAVEGLDVDALESVEKNIMAGYDKMGNSKAKMKKDEGEEPEEDEEEEEEEGGMDKNMMAGYDKMGNSKAKMKKDEGEDEEEEEDEVEKAVNSSIFNTTAKFTPPAGNKFTIGDDEVVPGDTIVYPHEAASTTGVEAVTPGETWALDAGDLTDRLRIAAQSDPATAAMIALALDPAFTQGGDTGDVTETAEGTGETDNG